MLGLFTFFLTPTIGGHWRTMERIVTYRSPPKKKTTAARQKDQGDGVSILSDTVYLSISFRKSTPPQNRELNILIGQSKQ